MEKLRQYLNDLNKAGREQYAAACGTTVGYLRKAISAGQSLGADLCIALERESKGAVRCEDLRPEGVDWTYIRGTTAPEITSKSLHQSPIDLVEDAT